MSQSLSTKAGQVHAMPAGVECVEGDQTQGVVLDDVLQITLARQIARILD
jgi:hypothetical protein